MTITASLSVHFLLLLLLLRPIGVLSLQNGRSLERTCDCMQLFMLWHGKAVGLTDQPCPNLTTVISTRYDRAKHVIALLHESPTPKFLYQTNLTVIGERMPASSRHLLCNHHRRRRHHPTRLLAALRSVSDIRETHGHKLRTFKLLGPLQQVDWRRPKQHLPFHR